MNPLLELGRRITLLRRERKLSRNVLAKRSGLSARFLADVESGRGNISISRLLDLCEALQIPAGVLVSGLPAAPDRKKTSSSILSQLVSLNPEQIEELRLWMSQRFDQDRPLIALVGLRGAGKTTIGRKVAAKLRKDFVELDEQIEKAAGLTLQNIFEVHGEEYYRRLEHDVLVRFLAERPSAVLATGGGIVARADTYRLLKQHCLTFWLKARPEEHWNRVLQQDPRPMVNHPNAMEQLQTLLHRREPLYAQADHVIDTTQLGIAGSVHEITSYYRNRLDDRGNRKRNKEIKQGLIAGGRNG